MSESPITDTIILILSTAATGILATALNMLRLWLSRQRVVAALERAAGMAILLAVRSPAPTMDALTDGWSDAAPRAVARDYMTSMVPGSLKAQGLDPDGDALRDMILAEIGKQVAASGLLGGLAEGPRAAPGQSDSPRVL